MDVISSAAWGPGSMINGPIPARGENMCASCFLIWSLDICIQVFWWVGAYITALPRYVEYEAVLYLFYLYFF